jgi:transposase
MRWDIPASTPTVDFSPPQPDAECRRSDAHTGQEKSMFYVGLDVSVARTAVCIMNATGQVTHEQSIASTPEAIAATIRASGDDVERVGLEAGINSAWIARGLQEAELPVIVIDATHATAALKTGFRNKTDKNDARGIADLMRVNRSMHVTSYGPSCRLRD